MGSPEHLTAVMTLLVTGARVVAGWYVVAVTSLLMWTMLPMAWGWQPTLVVGESMAPTIRAGDVLVAAPVVAAASGARSTQIAPGQIVVFDRPGMAGATVVHRVLRAGENGTVVTRGDANTAADSTPVRVDQIRGQVRLRIPYLGWPMYQARLGNWQPFAGWAVGTCLIAAFAAGGWRRRLWVGRHRAVGRRVAVAT